MCSVEEMCRLSSIGSSREPGQISQHDSSMLVLPQHECGSGWQGTESLQTLFFVRCCSLWAALRAAAVLIWGEIMDDVVTCYVPYQGELCCPAS